MFLNKLILTNFKSHELLYEDIEKDIVFIHGNNGVGKTNVLDAIHYLALFKSHIQHQDSKLIKHGMDFFRIEGHFEDNYKVVCKYRSRKEVEINDTKVAKLNSIFGHIPYVISSPNDIFLLHGGSDERRKFIDYTISYYDKEYLKYIIGYNKILAQRNALLKAETLNTVLLDTYTEKLIELCLLIYPKRKDFLSALIKLSSQWYKKNKQ